MYLLSEWFHCYCFYEQTIEDAMGGETHTKCNSDLCYWFDKFINVKVRIK